MQNTKIAFPKHWVDVPTQLSVLAFRGLIIDDAKKAADFLAYINYYRFTGYCLRFQFPPDAAGVRNFRPGTTFSSIVLLSQIDASLRDVFATGLELVEISVKAAIADVFGRAYDAFGHLDPAHFAPAFTTAPRRTAPPPAPSPYVLWLEKLRAEVRRSREQFITHFKKMYLEYPDLPIWMTCEVASFGSVSKLYENMLRGEQRAISNRYGLQSCDMDSWLHAFVYQRNVCAHHARLWDKSLSITPRLPPAKIWRPVRTAPNNSLYPAAMTLNWMLRHSSSPPSAVESWRKALALAMSDLEGNFPQLLAQTGFPSDWQRLDIWA